MPRYFQSRPMFFIIMLKDLLHLAIHQLNLEILNYEKSKVCNKIYIFKVMVWYRHLFLSLQFNYLYHLMEHLSIFLSNLNFTLILLHVNLMNFLVIINYHLFYPWIIMYLKSKHQIHMLFHYFLLIFTLFPRFYYLSFFYLNFLFIFSHFVQVKQ